MPSLRSKVKNLKRKIIKKNGILLSTEVVEGVRYAFYLKHPGGIERVYYKKEEKLLFDVPVSPGSYEATFFYNDGKEKVSFKEYFYITENEKKIIQPEKSIVREEEGYIIESYENNADVTFIVFNGTKSTKKSTPFGVGYLLKKGYNVIACLQNNDQYQSLSFDAFKESVSPWVKGKQVFMYGASLGGYSAVYYAGAVNGTVIAASPLNSAHPVMIDRSGGRSPFYKSSFKHLDIIDNPLTDKNIYIIFDPCGAGDLFFVENFIKPAYPKLIPLTFNYAGHKVLLHVNKTRQLDGIITSIVSGEDHVPIDKLLKAVLLMQEKLSIIYV